jgi:outer membrane protein assembly factor BamB
VAKSKLFSFKKRYILYIFILLTLLGFATYLVQTVPFGSWNLLPEKPTKLANGSYSYNIPLDPESPWPKFRANAIQNGRTPVEPMVNELEPWEYKTAKGIFSSPVVDQEGTVYIGSADHYFYAIKQDGSLKWKFATDEIIDSSALLDDRKRVYFGSGDGHVYCLNRQDGKFIWRQKAHTTQEVRDKFGIETFNLNWFEGNIGMLKDGSIIAPNDNYLIYALNRDNGDRIRHYQSAEMNWSIPSYNPDTDRLFFGSMYIALKNTFAYQAGTGEKLWSTGGLGSVAASSLLTSTDPRGGVILGGFDGILRALTQENGKELWQFKTRDHIYGSPGQLSDGTIIQASADGTIYAVHPEAGEMLWAYDTLEPIRSSPAIDANDNIYIGSGEGKLFAINPDGTLRWSFQLISDARNDLNASPALGKKGIYIAGENGGIFFVPYDYPLTEKGKNDPRSNSKPGEALPDDGVFLIYTTRFGSLQIEPPAEIDANEPLMFTLYTREKGDTIASAIDSDQLKISFPGTTGVLSSVSADKKFITLIPQETWTGPDGGTISINIKGDYLTDMTRIGLKALGGNKAGEFNQTFTFKVRERNKSLMPYQIPKKPGDLSSVLEFSRLSIPNPTMMPSWNQIGFDSLHYVAGAVESSIEDGGNSAVMWVVPGKLNEQTGQTDIDPSLKDVFVLNLNYDNGLVTLTNYEGFEISFVGSWDMPVSLYRLATKVDASTGKPLRSSSLNAVVRGDDIKFYGNFLKGMGLTDFSTGLMHIYGGTQTNNWKSGVIKAPENVGQVKFELSKTSITARVTGSKLKTDQHLFSILLLNSETGRPIPANYARATQVEANSEGIIETVTLSFPEELVKENVRAYFMVDTYPAVRREIVLKK